MSIYLIGGGQGGNTELLRPFIEAAGGGPITTVMVDEGGDPGEIARFTGMLTAAGAVEPIPVVVGPGESFDPATLDGGDALFICGGLTPAYAAALAPSADVIRDWVGAGHPYAGFSAGAAVAATDAIIGGWLLDGVPITHEDNAENLDELTILDGLGLVPFSIDVHCAQWGTLSRAVAAVESGAITIAVGLDEHTMLTVDASGDATVSGDALVSGSGQVWVVAAAGDGVTSVQVFRDGDRVRRPGAVTG